MIPKEQEKMCQTEGNNNRYISFPTTRHDKILKCYKSATVDRSRTSISEEPSGVPAYHWVEI
jgi:hypothetical protein